MCLFRSLHSCAQEERSRIGRVKCIIVSDHRTHVLLLFTCTSRILSMNVYPGGSLRYLGGAYVRYQNLKIPLKHWFLAKKAPLFLKKRWHFPLNKHPFFYQNTDIGWTGTRILTLNFMILCLFRGSRLGSSDINIDTNNIRCISKVQYCWTTDSEAQPLRESLGVRAAYIS